VTIISMRNKLNFGIQVGRLFPICYKKLLLENEILTTTDKALAYNHIFNLCVAQFESCVYVEIAKLLKLSCQSHLLKIKAKQGHEKLKELVFLYNSYSKSSQVIANISRYLQRYWIPSNSHRVTSDGFEVQCIVEFSRVMWNSICFEALDNELMFEFEQLLKKIKIKFNLMKSCEIRPVFDSPIQQLHLDALLMTRIFKLFINCGKRQIVFDKLQKILGADSNFFFAKLFDSK